MSLQIKQGAHHEPIQLSVEMFSRECLIPICIKFLILLFLGFRDCLAHSTNRMKKEKEASSGRGCFSGSSGGSCKKVWRPLSMFVVVWACGGGGGGGGWSCSSVRQ